MCEAVPSPAGKRLGAFGGDPRALNALKHGLTSQTVLAEEESAYYCALEALQEDYEPQTAYERALVRRPARLIVGLERAAMVEARSFAAIFPGDAAENAPGQGFSRLAFCLSGLERVRSAFDYHEGHEARLRTRRKTQVENYRGAFLCRSRQRRTSFVVFVSFVVYQMLRSAKP